MWHDHPESIATYHNPRFRHNRTVQPGVGRPVFSPVRPRDQPRLVRLSSFPPGIWQSRHSPRPITSSKARHGGQQKFYPDLFCRATTHEPMLFDRPPRLSGRTADHRRENRRDAETTREPHFSTSRWCQRSSGHFDEADDEHRRAETDRRSSTEAVARLQEGPSLAISLGFRSIPAAQK